jgi:hypothetical protein
MVHGASCKVQVQGAQCTARRTWHEHAARRTPHGPPCTTGSLIVLWLLWRNAAVARLRLGVVAMLALVVIMIVWLTPQIVTVGRSLDFVPREPPPQALARFGVLHGLYLVLESGKLLIGLIVTVLLARVAPYRAQPVRVIARGS